MIWLRRDLVQLVLLLVITPVLLLFSLGTFPLVLLAFLLWWFGGSVVTYLLTVVLSSGLAGLYFHVLGLGATFMDQLRDVLSGQLDLLIFALLVMNGFLVVFFNSRLIQDGILNWVRCRARTPQQRVRGALLASLCCFADDAASCLVMNRLLRDDIACEGVRDAVKRRFLSFILIGSNLPAALVAVSSWGILFQDRGWLRAPDGIGRWGVMLVATYPLCCLFYLMFNAGYRSTARKQVSSFVMKSELLLESPSGMGGRLRWVGLIPLLSFVGCIIGMISFFHVDGAVALLTASLIGLLLHAGCVHLHNRMDGLEPDSRQDKLVASVEDAVHTATDVLQEPRWHAGTGDVVCPPKHVSRRASIKCFEPTLGMLRNVRFFLMRLPSMQRRFLPAMRGQDAALFFGIEKTLGQVDQDFKAGVAEMITGLLRVLCVLVLSGIMVMCMGLNMSSRPGLEALPHADQAHASFLSATSWVYGQFETLGGVPESDMAGFVSVLSIALILIGLMMCFREMQFSSSWGLIAVFIPVGRMGLHLCGLGLVVEADWLIYGLVLSFGVWVNQTRATGDTVELTAEIQRRDPAELAAMTDRQSRWPLVAAVVAFVIGAAVVTLGTGSLGVLVGVSASMALLFGGLNAMRCRA